MKPYSTIKLEQFPDVGDIRAEGRKSSVGKLKRGETTTRYRKNIVSPENLIQKVKHNDRGYVKPAAKKTIRRNLKRSDKQKQTKLLEKEDFS